MTYKAYEIWLEQLSQAFGMEYIATDEQGDFAIELAGSKWISVAYSNREDKVICMLSLAIDRVLNLEDLQYLLRHNELTNHRPQQGQATQHQLALIRPKSDNDSDNDVVVILLRLPIADITPESFMQALEVIYNQSIAIENELNKDQDTSGTSQEDLGTALKA